MLDIADDLSSFTLAAGEPFVIDLILRDADGAAEPLAGRGFVLSFHDDERVVAAAIDGVVEDGMVRFARDGALSEALFGRPLTVEIAERLQAGRDVIASGRLAVTASAEAVAPLPDAAAALWGALVMVRAEAGGGRSVTRGVRRLSGMVVPPVSPPPPAPPPPSPPPPPPIVTLGALALSHAPMVAGRATTIAITGAQAGSAIAATLPAGLVLDGAARTIAGAAGAGEHEVVLVETLAGAAGSPRTTVLTLAVAAPPRIALSGAVAEPEGQAGTRAFVYTVTRTPATGAVEVGWTFAAGDTAPDDFAGGVYPAGGTVALADGVASGTFAVTVQGDGAVEPDERFTVAIVPPPGHVADGALSATGTILNDDAPPFAAFSANGAANTRFRAAVARVRAGTGRGRIVWQGDSVTVGQGAGSSADRWRLTGARGARIPAVVARLMSAAGTPALDASMVCDNGIARATGQMLAAAYDPRIAIGTDGIGWDVQGVAEFAGGGFWRPGTAALRFTPEGAVDRFEVVAYVSNTETYRLMIDGAAPAEGPASFSTDAAGGFVRHIVRAATPGSRTLAIAATTRQGALRSIAAWNGAVAALDMVVHAALGARAAHQAATGSNWSCREALVFDAPDLTVAMLGLNDMAGNVGAGGYAASLAAIVAAAQRSGDVLLVFPPAAAGAYNRDVIAYRDAAAGVAREAGVAFLDLWAHFGPWEPALAARMADGEVHPDADFAADMAAVIHRALAVMAPVG